MSNLKQSENSHQPEHSVAWAGGARKIFISLLSILVLGVFFCNSISAQINTANSSDEGIIVATVNVYNAQVVSNNGRDYKISFDISNRVGAQPQIKYAVRLTQVLAKSEPQVDEKVYDETISLGENTTVSKVINYSIPASLPVGTYRLWIDSKNGSGLMLGVVFVGEVKIAANVANTVQIVPDSCYLVTSTGLSPISQDMVIDPTNTLTANCKVTSTLSADTIFTPNFITRSYTSFGDIVSNITVGSNESITIKKGTNDITLVLPKALKPQNYNLTFSLVSADSKITSNAISFNYLLTGQSGTIQNVVFDKTYYKAGDTANLQIFSTQMGDDIGTITAIISNSDGVPCSVSSSKEISSFSVINLSIPITKNCTDPKANIILSVGENILDTNSFQVITPTSTTTSTTTATSTIILTLIIIVFVLIFSALIYKKKHSVIGMFIFVLVFTFTLFGFTKFADAHSYSAIDVYRDINQEGSVHVFSAGGGGNGELSNICLEEYWFFGWHCTKNFDNEISSFSINERLAGYIAPDGKLYEFGDDDCWSLCTEEHGGGICKVFGPQVTINHLPPELEDKVSSVLPVSCSSPPPPPPSTCIIDACRALPYGMSSRGQCTPVVSCIPISWQSLHCGGSYGVDCPDPLPGAIKTTYYGITTVSCNSVGQNCTYAPNSCTVSSEYCDYGCTPSGTCNPAPPPPTIPPIPAPGITFSASPSPVPYHQTSTLSWTVTGNHNGGCMASGNGSTRFWSKYVSSGSFSSGILNSDTTFSLSCVGTGGTRTSYLTLPVIHPAITSFSASPNLISYNSATTLNWTATNYAYCKYTNMQYTYTTSGSPIPPGTWHYTSSGSITTDILNTNTTYALFCAGNGHTPLAWTTVSVDPQTCTSWTYSPWGICLANNTQERTAIDHSPASCTGGSPVLSQPCPSCTSWTYSPWGICSPTDGTQTRTASNPSPINCSGGSPVLTQPCVPEPPSINLNANPTSVVTGHSSTISWSSTGATSCTITKNGGSFATGTSGSKSSGNLTSATTFTANCTNNGNSATKSVTVTIIPPPDTSLISNPSEIIWEDITPGDTCTLTDEDGTIISTETSGNYYDEDLPAGITFTLVCTGPGGTDYKEVTSKAPVIRSTCTNSTKNMYVNETTIWKVDLTNAVGATNINRTWGGTNISSNIPGLELSKIYTTVGPKTINATTTGKRPDGLSFTSVCSTTTIMKLDPGKNNEI